MAQRSSVLTCSASLTPLLQTPARQASPSPAAEAASLQTQPDEESKARLQKRSAGSIDFCNHRRLLSSLNESSVWSSQLRASYRDAQRAM